MPGEVSRTVMNIDATFFALEGGVLRHAFVLLASTD
jgi:hypothetical protein